MKKGKDVGPGGIPIKTLYSKIKCLKVPPQAPSLCTQPVTNFGDCQKMEDKVLGKKPEFTYGYLNDTKTTATNKRLTLQQKEANKAWSQKPWWHCAEMRTSCDLKCPNKKVPPIPRPVKQPCPDPFIHALHHLPHIRHYLMLENNRLYCHQIFSKHVNPLKFVYNKGLCDSRRGLVERKQRSEEQMKVMLAEWVENHRKRNLAYASNPISVFYTESSKSKAADGWFPRRNILVYPTCELNLVDLLSSNQNK